MGQFHRVDEFVTRAHPFNDTGTGGYFRRISLRKSLLCDANGTRLECSVERGKGSAVCGEDGLYGKCEAEACYRSAFLIDGERSMLDTLLLRMQYVESNP